MPTCRNPGRLDMVNTAEAGTDVPSRGLNGHVAEGYVIAHMSAELARQKASGVLPKGLPVSEVHILSSLVLRVVTEAQGCWKALQMVMEKWKTLNMSFRRWTFTLSP